MSALPSPRPERRRTRKQLLREIARLLEEQMDEMGLSEAEKNARTEAFAESVRKVKASRAVTPSK